MIALKILLALFLCVATATGQVQIYTVMDLSGGLVNSVANSLMQDNQFTIFDNLEYDAFGNLKRRNGMTIHYVDTTGDSANAMVGIVPFFAGYGKKMLTIRHKSLQYGDLRDSVYVVTLCDDAEEICTTTAYVGLFPGRRDATHPYNIDYATLTGDKFALASTQSELLLYNSDSNWVYPSRPLGPGQIKVVPINGAGTISGSVRYKYAYVNTSNDTSNFSMPSWSVGCNYSKNFLFNFAPVTDSTDVDLILLYRDDGLAGTYLALDSFATTQTDPGTYTDNVAFGSLDQADTATYEWGFGVRNRLSVINSPGSPGVRIKDTVTTDGSGIRHSGRVVGSGCSDTLLVGYSIVYVDVNGVFSYASPPTWAITTTASTNGTLFGFAVNESEAIIENILTPVDGGIVGVWLLRAHSFPLDTCNVIIEAMGPGVIPRYGVGNWIFWDSLDVGVDVAVDSISIINVVTKEFYCVGDSLHNDPFGIRGTDSLWVRDSTFPTYTGYKFYGEGLVYGDLPEDPCYTESTITFQPSAVVAHGSRLYAIGDQKSISSLRWSDFGRPYNWPPNKEIAFSTAAGDWLVALLSIDSDQLMIFRQNSILQLSGLSYFQYRITELIAQVGVSAPRSLAYGANETFFAHTTGVYDVKRFQTPDDRPVSWVIKNTVDSVGDKMPRTWGGIFQGEYWWSVAITSEINEKSYVYGDFPAPHWRCYTFGLQDATLFDYDTTELDYRTDQWILLRENDSLYRWNYTTTDSDGTVPFVGKLKTKAFLEGPGKKKILWLEIVANGSCDSLGLTFYDNEGSEAIETKRVAVDFDDDRTRIKVDHIMRDFAFKIEDDSLGDYTLTGFRFAWIPWEDGQ